MAREPVLERGRELLAHADTVVRDVQAVERSPAGPLHVALDELAPETLLVAGGKDSPGYTAAVLAACRAAGFEPRIRPDPYPDLGTQAIREGLGIVLYVRTAFGPQLEGSVLVPLEPVVTFPFVLVWREDARSAALRAILVASGL